MVECEKCEHWFHLPFLNLPIISCDVLARKIVIDIFICGQTRNGGNIVLEVPIFNISVNRLRYEVRPENSKVLVSVQDITSPTVNLTSPTVH